MRNGNVLHQLLELDEKRKLAARKENKKIDFDNEELDKSYMSKSYFELLCLYVFCQKPEYFNQVDSNGDTPLHKAIKMERWSFVSALLQFGADPVIKDRENNKTAVELAELKLVEIKKSEKHYYGKDPIEWLNQLRTAVLLSDNSSHSIASYIFKINESELQSSLFVYFIYKILPNVDENLALKMQNQFETTSELASKYSMRSESFKGKTSFEVIECFLTQDIIIRNRAASESFVEFLWNFLIDLDLLDPKEVDIEGGNMLHQAYMSNRYWTNESIKFLIKNLKIDPFAKNNAGMTPLQVWVLHDFMSYKSNETPEFMALYDTEEEFTEIDFKNEFIRLGKWLIDLNLSKEAVIDCFHYVPPKNIGDLLVLYKTFKSMSSNLSYFFNDPELIQALFERLHEKHEALSQIKDIKTLKNEILSLKERVISMNEILKRMHEKRKLSINEKIPGPHVAVREQDMSVFDEFLDALSESSLDMKRIDVLIEKLGNAIGNNTSFNNLPPEILYGIFGCRYELMKKDKEKLQNQSVASSKNEIDDSDDEFDDSDNEFYDFGM